MATKTTDEDQQRLHNLFENEVEGRIYSPETVHKMFMDDGLNDRLDLALSVKEQKRNIFVSLWYWLIGK